MQTLLINNNYYCSIHIFSACKYTQKLSINNSYLAKIFSIQSKYKKNTLFVGLPLANACRFIVALFVSLIHIILQLINLRVAELKPPL